MKLREQYNKHNTTNKETYFKHNKVRNMEQLWLHHKIIMKLRSHTRKTIN